MDGQSKLVQERFKRDDGQVRVPYARPALKVYGSIVALTHTVGNMGKVNDGGGGPRSKTS